MGLFSFVVDTVSDIVEAGVDAIYSTGNHLADDISLLNNVSANIIDKIGDSFEAAGKMADAGLDFAGDIIETGFGSAGDMIETTLDFAGDVEENVFDLAGDVVEKSADFLGDSLNLTSDWIGKGIREGADISGDIINSVFSSVGADEKGSAINRSLDTIGNNIAEGMDIFGDTLNRSTDSFGRGSNSFLDELGAIRNDSLDSQGQNINTVMDMRGQMLNTSLDTAGKTIEDLAHFANIALDVPVALIKTGGLILSTLVRASFAAVSGFSALIFLDEAKALCIWTRFVSDTSGALGGGIYDLLGEENSNKALKWLGEKTKIDLKEACADNIGECDGEKLTKGGCEQTILDSDLSEEKKKYKECNEDKALDSVLYVNGINTFKKNACITAHLLSKATCSNVTGIYNATEGIGADVKECTENIKRNSQAPATETLKNEIIKKLTAHPPEKVIIYAHSQGGLVTQEALEQVQNELLALYDDRSPEDLEKIVKLMAMIDVKSFGTAINGWVKGPSYEHLTNTSDPVPKLIQGIQDKISDYDDKSKFDNTKTHIFTDGAYVDPFGPHSMDNVYINEYVGLHGECSC